MTGNVPTGADLSEEGSSAETDSDIATAKEIPATEDILRKGQQQEESTAQMPCQYPAPPPAPSGGAPKVEEHKHTKPHAKNVMEDIE